MGHERCPRVGRDCQSSVGREMRAQWMASIGKLPDGVVAGVGGGSNGAGIFAPLIADEGVRLIGVEAAGEGVSVAGRHAATLSAGRPGGLHGMHTYVLQDDDGQTLPVHSVSAGLGYPGVGAEHSFWKDTGGVEYVAVDDKEALEAFTLLCETEGIIPALESAHAIAHAARLAPTLTSEQTIVINLSGRGDKDVVEVGRLLGQFSDGSP